MTINAVDIKMIQFSPPRPPTNELVFYDGISTETRWESDDDLIDPRSLVIINLHALGPRDPVSPYSFKNLKRVRIAVNVPELVDRLLEALIKAEHWKSSLVELEIRRLPLYSCSRQFSFASLRFLSIRQIHQYYIPKRPEEWVSVMFDSPKLQTVHLGK